MSIAHTPGSADHARQQSGQPAKAPDDPRQSSPHAARQAWMGLLAKSSAVDLAAKVEAYAEETALPSFTWLRAPEIGGVMVRGRMGGTGAAFNLGEMTVTRCALRLDTGETGHGYVQGRSTRHAEQAAMVDALMQTARADAVRAAVLTPLEVGKQAEQAARAAKAARTKVDFFTLARGED